MTGIELMTLEYCKSYCKYLKKTSVRLVLLKQVFKWEKGFFWGLETKVCPKRKWFFSGKCASLIWEVVYEDIFV